MFGLPRRETVWEQEISVDITRREHLKHSRSLKVTPNIPAKDYDANPHAVAIGKAARNLDDLRNKWLNPSDLIRVEPEATPTAAECAAGATSLYPDRIVPINAAAAATLRERTLTNFYNQRPAWLVHAYSTVDLAVAAAYGWPADISDDDALAKLLELNLSRTVVAKTGPAGEIDGDLVGEDDSHVFKRHRGWGPRPEKAEGIPFGDELMSAEIDQARAGRGTADGQNEAPHAADFTASR